MFTNYYLVALVLIVGGLGGGYSISPSHTSTTPKWVPPAEITAGQAEAVAGLEAMVIQGHYLVRVVASVALAKA